MLGSETVPGFAPSVVDTAPNLDQQALAADLDDIRDVLSDALPNKDINRVEYCVQFVASIVHTAQDQDLMNGAVAFFQSMEWGTEQMRGRKSMLELVQKKLDEMPQTVSGSQNVA